MSLSNKSDCKKNAQQKILIEPTFGEFQLIGDNLLVQFADQILQQRYAVVHGSRAIGYCVSGQRIAQLRRRIKLKCHPLSSKVMVLIGSSDVLCGENVHTMTKNFAALLKTLRKSTDKILILTLPPIPKLCVTFYHWTLIRQYNSFLKGLDDGESVTVADVCPLFTKFSGALEYDINAGCDGMRFPIARKRKSAFKHRGKYFSYRRKQLTPEMRFKNISDMSDSDYRNTTDTSASIDSDIISSEISQGKEELEDLTEVFPVSSRKTYIRSSKKLDTSAGFVVRTLQSVLGKGILNRRKIWGKSEMSSAEQSEKRPRRCLDDVTHLSEDVCAMDNWKVESDEDSMDEQHIYKSQEEIAYDFIDLSDHKNIGKSDEFSKFLESCNDSQDKGRGCSKWEKSRNERPESTESSSSSESSFPVKPIYPFVDNDFRYFLEKSSRHVGGGDSSLNGGRSRLIPGTVRNRFHAPSSLSHADASLSKHSPTISEFPTRASNNNCKKLFETYRGFKSIEGISENDQLLLQLAKEICHLQWYQLFSPSGKKRLDMIQLNYHGLNELKKFLISNNYISL